MSGFLAGIWGRVFAPVPGNEANDSRLPEAQRATGGQWQSAAPVQRVLDGVSPAVVSHDLAAHLATHQNPALTGGDPAPARGLPVLDAGMRGEHFGVPADRAHSAWRRTETAAPSAARPGARAGKGGSDGPTGGAVGSPAPVKVPLPGPAVPVPTTSNDASAPSEYSQAVPTEGTFEPRKASVQRVTRATPVRSARSPFLSAPPAPAGRRLAAVVARAEDRAVGTDRVPTNPAHAVEPSPPRTGGADRSASRDRPVPSAPVSDTPEPAPPAMTPGRDAARVPHTPAPALVRRTASQADLPATRTGRAVQTAHALHTEHTARTGPTTRTAYTDLPARTPGSQDAGNVHAGAGELPPTTQPVHTQATGNGAIAPTTAQAVAPATAVQRSANRDARTPNKPPAQGGPSTRAPQTAAGAASSTSNAPGREAGSPPSDLGLGTPLRQQPEGTPARSTAPVQRTPAVGRQVGRADRPLTTGGAHHLGLGAPLRSRPSDPTASARPDGRIPAPTAPSTSASGPTAQGASAQQPDQVSTVAAPARTTGAEPAAGASALRVTTDNPAAPLRASTAASASRTVVRSVADRRATAAEPTPSGTPHTEPSHPVPSRRGTAQAARPASSQSAESALTPAEQTTPDGERGVVIQRRVRSGAGEFPRNHVAVSGRVDTSASVAPGGARALAPSKESSGTHVQRSTAAAAADRSPVTGAAPGEVSVARPSQTGRTTRVGPEASGSGSQSLPAVSGGPLDTGRPNTSPSVVPTAPSSSAAPVTGDAQGSAAVATGRTSPAQPTASLAPVRRRVPLHRAGRSTPQTLRPVAAAAMPRVLTVPVQRSHAGTPSPRAMSRSTAVPENAAGPGSPGAAGRDLGQGQDRGTDPAVRRPVAPVRLPVVRPRTATVAPKHAATSSPPLVVQLLGGQAPRPAPGPGGPATKERSRVTAPPVPGPQLPPSATTTSAGRTAAASPSPSGGQPVPVPTPITPRQGRAPFQPSPVPAAPSRTPRATPAPAASRTPRAAAAPSAPATVQRAGQSPRAARPIAPSAGRTAPSVPSVAPGTGRTPGPLPSPPPDRSLTVQRQGQASPVQRGLPAPGPGTSTAAGTPGGPGPALHALPPESLDALARSLLEPLSRLLRSELRGDRERIGRLRDTP